MRLRTEISIWLLVKLLLLVLIWNLFFKHPVSPEARETHIRQLFYPLALKESLLCSST